MDLDESPRLKYLQSLRGSLGESSLGFPRPDKKWSSSQSEIHQPEKDSSSDAKSFRLEDELDQESMVTATQDEVFALKSTSDLRHSQSSVPASDRFVAASVSSHPTSASHSASAGESASEPPNPPSVIGTNVALNVGPSSTSGLGVDVEPKPGLSRSFQLLRLYNAAVAAECAEIPRCRRGERFPCIAEEEEEEGDVEVGLEAERILQEAENVYLGLSNKIGNQRDETGSGKCSTSSLTLAAKPLRVPDAVDRKTSHPPRAVEDGPVVGKVPRIAESCPAIRKVPASQIQQRPRSNDKQLGTDEHRCKSNVASSFATEEESSRDLALSNSGRKFGSKGGKLIDSRSGIFLLPTE